jgi:CIC family chloride channel protein
VATTIGRCSFGIFPSFNVPAIAQVEGPGASLAGFVAFGLLVGLVAWVTTRCIYRFEDLFDRMPGNYYTRHMSGMLLVGLMMYGLVTCPSSIFNQANHYYLEGVGSATIMKFGGGTPPPLWPLTQRPSLSSPTLNHTRCRGRSNRGVDRRR